MENSPAAVLDRASRRVQEILTLPTHAIDGRMEPFDAILMDIQMPEMDGHEATRRLRERGFRGPIIALSAHAYESEVRGILEAGCNEFMAKPIQRERLLRVVERYLQ